MHPAYSVIFFTVTSGAGFGLFTMLGLAPLFGFAPTGAFGWTAFVLAYLLSVSGLVSSTFHLGHPERAWRALTQWRTSWLSREGVLAIATTGVAGLYAIGALFFDRAIIPLGLLTAILALITVYATSMIYGVLKTVQRWHQPLTPASYIAFSLAGGSVLMSALVALFSAERSPPLLVLALALLGGAWAIKLVWWRRGDTEPLKSTPASATGLGHLGRVRMLESPHTGTNYLMKEMVFTIARRHALKLRAIAGLAGGLMPALLILMASVVPGAGLILLIAFAVHIAGLFVERWLFFAEARHAVANYYDRG
ncbi:dimethyl sulfoxide reductase anchor subunit family protein [Pararhizobium haloflavum]|uniref:dimethyl sulfoxide reductase anchor subunit family protein n=1 Tax=Pararhizobium haloflavum TaxID=2037914 RepID=UPI000C19DF5D|nr:DmsC/YnfH family molybdoenzyme membrane anchor subunit [Pararhizobium haloflavum]